MCVRKPAFVAGGFCSAQRMIKRLRSGPEVRGSDAESGHRSGNRSLSSPELMPRSPISHPTARAKFVIASSAH